MVRFYELLARLEDALGGMRTLRECSGRLRWPHRGVYFFFEEGEERSDSGRGLRVVRVGTHALTDGARSDLWGRLRQHRGTLSSGAGDHRGSIFRDIVGTAIAAREPAHAVASWNMRRIAREERVHERALEILVTKKIAAMPFLWLAIGDEPGPNSRRGYIERNAIGLLSNYQRPTLDAPTKTWLGHACNRPDVCASGLWNQEHVDRIHEPAFLDTLEALVDAAGDR